MSKFEGPPRNEASLDDGGDESREQPGEYLYHMVPRRLQGEQLMPLNTLKDAHPDTYAEAAAKY